MVEKYKLKLGHRNIFSNQLRDVEESTTPNAKLTSIAKSIESLETLWYKNKLKGDTLSTFKEKLDQFNTETKKME